VSRVQAASGKAEEEADSSAIGDDDTASRPRRLGKPVVVWARRNRANVD
jgi:hypothetical protein